MGTLFGIAYTKAALDGLASAEPKKVRQQIKARIENLAIDQKPQGCAKMFGGLSDGAHEVYRVRQGDYRIIYSIRETEIIVLDIGHRKDIYR